MEEVKLVIRLGNKSIKVTCSENDTCIINSYRIKKRKDMKIILEKIRVKVPDAPYAINKLSINEMVNEWRVHNLLYSLGIEKDRTCSVDLNTPKPWYADIAYKILSVFYI